MSMFKYILKRVSLLVVTLFVIMTICFVLVKMLEPVEPMWGWQQEREKVMRAVYGYDKPIFTQYQLFLKNVFTRWDWGVSREIQQLAKVEDVIAERIPPTVIINIFSTVIAMPLAILLGIWAAIKKNKLTDHIISTTIMIYVSVPSFVNAFIVQYFVGFRLGWFPLIVKSRYDTGGSWLSGAMLNSMVLPIMALTLGSIAGMARFTRAELTEALTSEYMLLARAKGLSRTKAVMHHALKNAFVPILPSILASFVAVLGGSLVVERIFNVPGIGGLYIRSLMGGQRVDYDVFMALSMFYTAIGLSTAIVTDISYGFLDPRIRMGER